MNRDQFIAEHTIESVLERAGVKLIVHGNNKKALCPFHREKTPSFTVTIDKGLWHCFGCARGGSVIDLIAQLEGKEPAEVLRDAGESSKPWKPLPKRVVPTEETEHPDFDALLAEWRAHTDEAQVCWLASSLGVKCAALHALGTCQRDRHVFAFPMRDGDRKTIGIRLRDEDGRKWAVKGSRQGLFVSDWPASATAFVCEGPTDTAAALSLGLWAAGRASCQGNNESLRVFLKSSGVRNTVIVSDNDEPGVNGAMKLSKELRMPCAVLIPPAKDLRQFVQLGGTAEMLDQMLRETIWHRP